MKYLELDFIISPYSRDAADILMALVADAGLESFVDTPQGVKGYVQTGLFERSVLDRHISHERGESDLPIGGSGG